LVNVVGTRALPVLLEVLNLLYNCGTLRLKELPISVIVHQGDVVAGHEVVVEQLGTG
jgi:hypothetical protein